MSALELITVVATNPGAGAPGLAVPGNSLTIRDNPKKAWLTGLWQTRSAVGNTRITSPLLHDTTVGIQIGSGIGQYVDITSLRQPIHAQDTFSVTLIGSAAAIEHSSWLNFYEDLPGVQSHLIDESELQRRAENIMGVLVTTTPGTVAYGTQVAINATNDQFKANTDYAVIGATVQSGAATVGTHSLRITSSDFGNLGIGIPAAVIFPGSSVNAYDWFLRLSKGTGLPLIPVFNSANKALTLVDTIAAAATATTASIIVVQLAPKGASTAKRKTK